MRSLKSPTVLPLLPLLGFVGALVVPCAVSAELIPISPVFEVAEETITPPPTSPPTFPQQTFRTEPTVQLTPNGWLIVWAEEVFSPNGAMLLSRLEGSRLPFLDQNSINFGVSLDAPPERVANPALTSLPDGSVLVFWAQDQTAFSRGVRMQPFFPASIALGSEVLLEDPEPYQRSFGPRAVSCGARTMVAWAETLESDVSVSPLYPAARYQVRRIPMGEAPLAFTIEPTAELQRVSAAPPALALDCEGRFAVAWFEDTTLYLQTYDVDGAPTGPRQRISRRAEGAALTVLENGSYLLAWSERVVGGSQRRVRYARHSVTGARLGAPRSLGQFATFADATLVTVGDGAVLAWMNGSRLLAQHLGGDLARRGARVDLGDVLPPLPYRQGFGFGVAAREGELLFAWEGVLPVGSHPQNAIWVQRVLVR